MKRETSKEQGWSRLGWPLFVFILLFFLFVWGPRVPGLVLGHDLILPEFKLDDVEPIIVQRDGSAPLRHSDCASRLRWAVPELKQRTPLSLVYLHGFSASPLDLHPTLDLVAERLQANLLQYRLTGHGRRDDLLSETTAQDWFTDTVRAFAMGEALGERVVLIGTSTGASLQFLLLDWLRRKGFKREIAALVLLSPNFGLTHAGGFLLTWPWGLSVANLVSGKERNSWEPENELRARFWTTHYDLFAATQVQAVVDAADQISPESFPVPILMVHAKEDRVVEIDKMKEMAARLTVVPPIVRELSGSFRHELAGDAIAPELSQPLADEIVNFISQNVDERVRFEDSSEATR